MNTPQDHTTTLADLHKAWVLANRDDERRAFDAYYAAKFPRPAVDGGA